MSLTAGLETGKDPYGKDGDADQAQDQDPRRIRNREARIQGAAASEDRAFMGLWRIGQWNSPLDFWRGLGLSGPGIVSR